MKIINPIPYILLGGRLRYLVAREEGDKIVGGAYTYSNLIKLKKDIESLGFNVSLNLFNRKLGKLEKTFKELDDAEFLKKGENKLTKSEALILSDNITVLEDTIFSEAQEKIIASPTPRRFSLNHLLNSPDKILGKDVFENLTEIAQYDLKQACRSIAFECPTAAVFHILRCVEECVRILHKAYYKRKETNKPWGPLVTSLINKPRNPKPDDTLLEHLNHLRKRFRNPTNHPEMIYELEEAEDLVHLSVDAINRVMRDPKVKA